MSEENFSLPTIESIKQLICGEIVAAWEDEIKQLIFSAIVAASHEFRDVEDKIE